MPAHPAHPADRSGGPRISGWLIALIVVLGLLALVTVYDLTQRRHAILRNFPIVGHLRYLLEAFGPELRQYIVTGNDDERPFCAQRAPLDLRDGQAPGPPLRLRLRQ